ncbi:hypothetical protein [Streptomyces sp. NPDC017556]|uniref:hypothetical protein n=1 Tax=unclassified Streptomyces TaxID=2593676 RepID=UPI00378E50ED
MFPAGSVPASRSGDSLTFGDYKRARAKDVISWRTKEDFNGRRDHYELMVNYLTRKILPYQFKRRN